MSAAGLDMMFALVLESGRRWGEMATDAQIADVEAIFDLAPPHRHFLTRPRGGSKTTDTAGVALSWLAKDAPARSRGYVVASTTDQAAILIDAAAAFIARTPELEGYLVSENERIIAENGAWVRVLAQSDSGAWGLRDAHLLILDEFAQWPETRGAKRVYTAIRSTVQKVPGCRLIILTSAGEPSHWSYDQVFAKALSDKTWRVSELPGPVPWQDPEEIQALKRELRPSEYDRLVLNIWSEDEDRAISPEDYEAAAQRCFRTHDLPTGLTGGGFRFRAPRRDQKYLITVDVGIKNDATVVCAAHSERMDPDDAHSPKRLVIDHLERWLGSRRRPVQVNDVENYVVKVATEYNRAEVYADPTQFMGNLQNLNRRGIRAEEWAFSSASVGEVATALVQSFRNRQIWVPDNPALKEELLRVRLREGAPGVTRLDSDSQGHDDQAVAIGLACRLLLGKGAWSQSGAFKEMWQRQSEPEPVAPELRRFAQLLAARRQGPEMRRKSAQARCEHRWRADTCVWCGLCRETAPV